MHAYYTHNFYINFFNYVFLTAPNYNSLMPYANRKFFVLSPRGFQVKCSPYIKSYRLVSRGSKRRTKAERENRTRLPSGAIVIIIQETPRLAFCAPCASPYFQNQISGRPRLYWKQPCLFWILSLFTWYAKKNPVVRGYF